MFIPGGQKFPTHSRGEVKHFYAQRERGKHFYTQHFYTQGGGAQTISNQEEDTHFYTISGGGTNIHTQGEGGGDKHFMLELVVDEDEDVSEANIIPSKGNKLSAGARVLRDL